jgi:uncharacterized protein (TIGR02001 family)
MKRLRSAATLALGLMTVSAFAADMKVRAKAPEPPPSPWDFAFGSALMSDYIARGITQSNHKPSVAAYFEPRYNFNDTLQGYAGISGESIAFPNRPAAEIDGYGGIRPTFGKLALDFGFWYYWYPGGQCFDAILPGVCAADGNLPINGNVVKADLSFWEFYTKATYTLNDQWSYGGSVWYSPSVLNSGADGTFLTGNLKYTFPGTFLPMFPGGVGAFISTDVGHWFLGTTDSTYCTLNAAGTACGGAFPGGIPYKNYTTWDVGLGLTWKKFTLDLRYYDTDLNKGDCNAFTSAQNASGFNNVTRINPGGAGTNWCGSAFVVKFSADLTLADLK